MLIAPEMQQRTRILPLYLTTEPLENDSMAMAIPISLEQVMASQPPPGLEEWRKRLFLVEGTIEMSEDEYVSYPFLVISDTFFLNAYFFFFFLFFFSNFYSFPFYFFYFFYLSFFLSLFLFVSSHLILILMTVTFCVFRWNTYWPHIDNVWQIPIVPPHLLHFITPSH